jgi:hypothetical protein
VSCAFSCAVSCCSSSKERARGREKAKGRPIELTHGLNLYNFENHQLNLYYRITDPKIKPKFQLCFVWLETTQKQRYKKKEWRFLRDDGCQFYLTTVPAFEAN